MVTLTPQHPSKQLLKEAAAAEYLATPKGTLRNWRWRGYGPAYVRVGRSVRYRVSDLERFLEATTVRPVNRAEELVAR